MRKLLFPFFIVLFTLSSCNSEYEIEKRAKQQIMASLPQELSDLNCGAHDWRVEDLKTVYANDTICLLQCTVRYHDGQNNKGVRDYRYIYLMDMIESRMAHRPVFTEEFRNVLCMPDDLIEECKRNVKKDKENIYDEFYGKGVRVMNPYDAPKK